MKKILLGILALGAVSCSNNDDEPSQNQNNIIGVWKIQSKTTISGTDKTTVLGQEVIDDCKKQSTYEFRNDGKYYLIDYNSIGTNCQKSTATVDYTYNQAEQKITVNGSVSTVPESTTSKLVLLTPDNYDYNSDGVDDYIKYTFYK